MTKLKLFWIISIIFFSLNTIIYFALHQYVDNQIKDHQFLNEKLETVRSLTPNDYEHLKSLYHLNANKYYQSLQKSSEHDEAPDISKLQLNWNQAKQALLKILNPQKTDKLLSKDFLHQLSHASPHQLKNFEKSYQLYDYTTQYFNKLNNWDLHQIAWDLLWGRVSGSMTFEAFDDFIAYLLKGPHHFYFSSFNWEIISIDQKNKKIIIHFDIGLKWEDANV